MSGARADSPRLIERLTAPVERFLGLETSSSILLLAATVLALAWANSPWAASYEHLLHVPFALRIGDFELAMSFAHVVNDALMGIFFFVVGMEIKRELVIGELSSPSRALLPVLAAAGGMIVPAGIYASLHWGEPTLRGWGIPMATDIAFAVAALSAFGRRVPPGLKIFLLALAIADDIGAVSVIAIFYTAELSVEWLAWAAAGLAFTYAMNLAGVRHYAAYIAIGGVVWFATYQSGVHATIAGVALGLITPARPLAPPPDRETLLQRGMHWLERLGQAVEGENDHGGHARYEIRRRLDATARATLSPADDLIHVLHPWVAFVIMPVFALANAGVPLDPATLGQPDAMRVGAAVAAGLLIGKPVGIASFAWLAVRLGLARLPRGVSWGQVVGAGALAGIGFTVALFVSALAFGELEAVGAGSKVGILGGSVLATLIGAVLLSQTLPREAPAPAAAEPGR